MNAPALRRLVRPVACWLGVVMLLGTARVMAADKTNSPLLTVKRIFDSGEFGGDGFSARWLEDSSGYTTFESSKDASGGRDLVRHDPKTGNKEILVPASDFVPPGASSPLGLDEHTWSKDKSRLLLFTNTKRVWRTHSRGDYWVLDRSSHELFKVGGDAQPSTLMFAKFSPDGRRVAYVRERNIYVQDLSSRRITALMHRHWRQNAVADRRTGGQAHSQCQLWHHGDRRVGTAQGAVVAHRIGQHAQHGRSPGAGETHRRAAAARRGAQTAVPVHGVGLLRVDE